MLLNQLLGQAGLFLGGLALAFSCFMNCHDGNYGSSTRYSTTDRNNFHDISTAAAVKT